MSRVVRFLARVLLVIVSVYLAVQTLRLLDVVVGLVLPLPPWPNPSKGLIFIPGSEESFDMADYQCSVRINSMGIRDREFGSQKLATIRALAIGDSFTYGWGVNLEDTWCKRLERNLREQGIDIEILNLGRPGSGPREYARLARTAIPLLKPDLVILGILMAEDFSQVGDCWSIDPENYIKDTFPNLLTLGYYLQAGGIPVRTGENPCHTAADVRKTFAESARGLADSMSGTARARLDAVDSDIKNAFFAGMVNPSMVSQAALHPDLWKASMEPTRWDKKVQTWRVVRCLRRINAVAQRNGAHVIAVSIPQGFNANHESFSGWQRLGFVMDSNWLQSDSADRDIAEACARAGITTFHSVLNGFRERKNETGLYFILDQHMSPRGHALFADLVGPAIATDIARAAGHTSPP